MLIAYLQEKYPNFLNDPPNIENLEKFYKESKDRFKEDADFKKISQENVVKLQAGNPDYIKAWKIFCHLSRTEFQKIYQRLEITLIEKGESFYNPLIPDVIKELNEKGLVTMSKGA